MQRGAKVKTIVSDIIGDLNSPFDSPFGSPPSQRLPSLLALRCFEAAARLEHFTRAAEELHLTHGAVSRAVRLLEDDLGVPLFERRSRRVFLTDAGRQLAQAVHEGLGLMLRATQEIRATATRRPQWMLSCEPTLLMRWLIPRWPAFQARHPEVDIHLLAGGGHITLEHGIHLAIRRNDFAWPAHYHAELLFTEATGPVCRPDKVPEWFTTAKARQPAILRRNAPLLHTRTRPDAWQRWSQGAHTARPQPSSKGQTFEHFYLSLQAAVAGMGVAIGPYQLVRDDIDSGQLVAPLGFQPDGSSYCLLSSSSEEAPGLQADLLQWLRAEAAQHDAETLNPRS